MLVAALSQIPTGEGTWGGVPPLLPVALGLAAALPLRWRRERPLAVMVVVAGITTVALLRTTGDPPFGVFVAVLLCCVALGQHAPLRVAAPGMLLPAVPVAVLLLSDPLARPWELVFPLFYFGAAWGVGREIRRRHRVAERLTGLVAALDAERDVNARLAAEAERLRIAREVHDVIAHSLGVIAIHAEAAEALLDRGSADIHRPLGVITAAAREALEELRGVLGGLRADAPAPQRGLAAVPELIDRFRAAGMTVRFAVTDSHAGSTLRDGIEVTAFRLVQEALTNVLRHAPGATVAVTIGGTAEALHIAVRDNGERRASRPVASPSTAMMRLGVGGRGGAEVADSVGPTADVDARAGFGLAGMRERVGRLGGTVTAGRTPDGGFTVEARLPLDEVVA